MSVLSNIAFLRFSFRLAVAFKLGRPCARSEAVGLCEFLRGPVPAPQGRANPFRARRAYNVGSSYCVASHVHAGIHTRVPLRSACLAE